MMPEPRTDTSIERERLELEKMRVEIEAKRSEIARTGRSAVWASPLLLSVVTAVVGLLVNSVLESRRASQARDLERRKEEAALILKAVESPDSVERAANLNFFLEARLLSDSSGEIRAVVDRILGAGAATRLPVVRTGTRVPGTYAQGVLPGRAVSVIVLSDGMDILDPDRAKRALQDTTIWGSYHYLIDTTGRKHSIVPEENVAFTVGVASVNRRAVSIGLLHGRGQPFPPAQTEQAVRLIAELLCRYNVSVDSVEARATILRRHGRREPRTDLLPQMQEIRRRASQIATEC